MTDWRGNDGQHYTFSERGTTQAVEEGRALSPKFDAEGLVTCVATDAASGDVLMVAHMNAEALARTVETGEAWYYSRSRRALWRKGESSGHVQRVTEMRIDCDQDAVWIKVEQAGPAPATPGGAHASIARCRSARRPMARSSSNFARRSARSIRPGCMAARKIELALVLRPQAGAVHSPS